MKVDNHCWEIGSRASPFLVLRGQAVGINFVFTLLIPVLETNVKSFCKTLVLGMVIGVMTMMPIGKAHCQSAPEPAVIISIANFKEQMDDVDYLLTSSGFP
jgi:hypothetical protein